MTTSTAGGRGVGRRDDPRWWRLKDRVKARAGELCEYCGLRYIADLHHRCYDRYGRERAADVMGVCRPCHRAIHGRYRGVLTGRAGSLLARGDPGTGITAAWREYLRGTREGSPC